MSDISLNFLSESLIVNRLSSRAYISNPYRRLWIFIGFPDMIYIPDNKNQLIFILHNETEVEIPVNFSRKVMWKDERIEPRFQFAQSTVNRLGCGGMEIRDILSSCPNQNSWTMKWKHGSRVRCCSFSKITRYHLLGRFSFIWKRSSEGLNRLK
jgi:hypothetical protein